MEKPTKPEKGQTPKRPIAGKFIEKRSKPKAEGASLGKVTVVAKPKVAGVKFSRAPMTRAKLIQKYGAEALKQQTYIKTAIKNKSVVEIHRSHGGYHFEIKDFVSDYPRAPVGVRVQVEEHGVRSADAKRLFKALRVADSDVHVMIGMPKSTYHRRIAPGGVLTGSSGHAIAGYADLLQFLVDQIAQFGDPETKGNFDAGEWLGRWLRELNPSLGGTYPSDLMTAPSGREAVKRALGAIFSGSFQ